jgi:hypothetical protein
MSFTPLVDGFFEFSLNGLDGTLKLFLEDLDLF